MDSSVAVVISVVTGVLCYWLYNNWQHNRKLAWIPRVPGHPLVGNILDFKKSTEYLKVMLRYTQRCDGLVQVAFFTNRMILTSNYDFLEFLMSSTQVLDKSREYSFLNRWLGTGLLTAPGSKWKKSRKIITPAFHFTILEQFIDVFEKRSQIMVDILRKECDQSVTNIYPFVTNCTLDIISETAMGVSIDAQTTVYSDYVYSIKEMCRITVHRAFSIFKMFDLTYFFTRDYWLEQKYVKVLHDHTNSVIQARKKAMEHMPEDKSTNGDEVGQKKKMAFLDLLLQAKEDGAPMTDERIREEVDTIMFEGHDTTTSGISFALYCLANHSDVQARAVEEQKSIFGSDYSRQATHRDLQDMKYLELVIKEALRLYPSVPFYSRLTDKEVHYKDGKVIPVGVPIIIFAFGVHRNPENFPDPEKFDPSRFEDSDRKPYAYIPFSAGPRNCIGQKFAMLEMKALISKVLRNFELLSAGDAYKPILAAETLLISLNGINLKLKEREWK